MTNSVAIARASSNALATPVTYRYHHLIRDVNPAWGIGYGEDSMPAQDVALPSLLALELMQQELDQALLPCTIEQAAKSAQYLIAAYPQQDKTTAAYVEQVTMRLAQCPPDMLARVVNRIIDDATDFRPAPGKVKQAVDYEMGKRIMLRMRVAAAMRATRRRRAEAETAAEIAAEKKHRTSIPALAMPAGDGSAWPIPQIVPEPRRPAGKPVEPVVVAALRAALSQKRAR